MKLKRILRISALVVTFLLYPIYYYFPVLGPHSGLRLGYAPSDTNLIVRQAGSLQMMRFPWSHDYWNNWPQGEKYWTTGNLINLGFNIPVWILTRFIDATLAVNLYALGGFFITGIASYLILRELKCSFLVSITFALIVQLLPWIRQVSEFGITHTYFLGLPLVTLWLLLRILNRPSVQRILILLFYLSVLCVTNPYLLMFSVCMAVVAALFKIRSLYRIARSLGPKSQTVLATSIVVTLVSIWGLYRFLIQFTHSTETGLPFDVYPKEVVQAIDYSALDFFDPRNFDHLVFSSPVEKIGEFPGYLGIGVGALLIMFLVLPGTGLSANLERTPKIILKFLVTESLVLMWIASNDIDFFGIFTIPSGNEFLRHLMPGIRHFFRAGIIVQGILLLMLALLVDCRFKVKQGSFARFGFLGLVMIIVIVDLNPIAYRRVHRDVTSMSIVNEVIGDSRSPVLNLINEIESDYIRAPLIKPDISALSVSSFGGSRSIHNYLQCIGARYLLIPASNAESLTLRVQDSVLVTVDLESPWFRKLLSDQIFTRTILNESEPFAFSMYEVKRINNPQSCNFSALGEVIFSPQLTFNESERFSPNLIQWSSNQSISLQLSTNSDGNYPAIGAGSFRLSLQLILPQSASLDGRAFWISSGQQLLLPTFDKRNRTYSWIINDQSNLRLHSRNECPDSIESSSSMPDRRCFGLKNFLVEFLEAAPSNRESSVISTFKR